MLKGGSSRLNQLYGSVIAAPVPICLLWLMYHGVTSLWWANDDTTILKSIIKNGILGHFYSSSVWQQFSTSNLTPWAQFSLGIDLHVFGLNPSGFYFHQLLSLTALVGIGYKVLRFALRPVASSLALVLFVASIPTASAAETLMVRHYIEGLALSSVALLLYVRAIRDGQAKWAWLGSIFYLLACTAKEVYVPLPALACFLPVFSLRARLKALIPFALVAFSYLLWRAYMLGPANILAGYGDVHGRPDINSFVHLPYRIAETLGWNSWWYAVVLIVIGIVCVLALVRPFSREKVFFCILALLICIGPIIPVITILNERYLFAMLFVATVAIGSGLEFLLRTQRDSRIGYLLMFSLWLCLVIPALRTSSEYLTKGFRANQASRITGQFVLSEGDQTGVLINPPSAIWFYESLLWIRSNVLHLPPGPKVCYDLCTCALDHQISAYRYSDGAIQKLDLARIKSDTNCGDSFASLTADLWFSSHDLHWKFGPYDKGQYYFCAATDGKYVSGFSYLLPIEGTFPMKLPDTLNFVIKYVSPEGWLTYSPELTTGRSVFDDTGQQQFHWTRN